MVLDSFVFSLLLSMATLTCSLLFFGIGLFPVPLGSGGLVLHWGRDQCDLRRHSRLLLQEGPLRSQGGFRSPEKASGLRFRLRG